MPADDARVAAIFDLDKTLIATSSATAFATPLLHGGLLTRRAMLRAAYARAAYLLGSADAKQTERLRAALSSMIRGWDVERVRGVVAETLTAAIEPAVFAEAIALLERHREQGHVLVVASASGEDVVRPIADLLGIHHVVATRMRVLEGHYTGDLEFYAYGQGKADAVRELAEREGWDLTASHAYTDSITDLPLLEAVGHPAVVNPDRALRSLAHERGWETLTFVRPTPIALPLPPARPTAAVGGAVVVLGVAWWLLRRRLRSRAA